MSGEEFNRIKEQGVTLLESIVATAIVAIGFIAIFQMVNYSVLSIDTSGERTKANYLVAMVAEDLIGDKNTIVTGTTKFKKHLINKKQGDTAWKMSNCSDGKVKESFTNAYDNKLRSKWDNRFSKKRIKCRSANDTRTLEVFDICSSKVAVGALDCKYKTDTFHFLENTGDSTMILAKMEVRLNNNRVKKFLYFQID